MVLRDSSTRGLAERTKRDTYAGGEKWKREGHREEGKERRKKRAFFVGDRSEESTFGGRACVLTDRTKKNERNNTQQCKHNRRERWLEDNALHVYSYDTIEVTKSR